MSNSNSRNLKFIVLMVFVLFLVFTYIGVYNNYDKIIYNDIKESKSR